jgi:4-hydroxythreonine-4-phosphate dehydrogenase
LQAPIPHLAITAGEPAGIGLDLCVLLAHQTLAPCKISLICDQHALLQRAQQLQVNLRINDSPQTHQGDGSVFVQHVACAQAVQAGQLNALNSRYVLQCLDRALQGCMTGEYDAMVTGPVNKAVINQAGIAFTGHTEYLAEQSATAQVVMMLVGGGMRVALATTHLALNQVSQHIQMDTLTRTIQILQHDLIHRFGIAQPRIMVAGLNPHAGEQGHLGDEEIKVITPVIQALQQQGYQLTGPLPADTMFNQKNLPQTDAFLAMYHDQGLTVLKHASFGEAVNITLGLPFIRTSVDHGTALDLAGTGKMDCGSFIEAIKLATQLAQKSLT